VDYKFWSMMKSIKLRLTNKKPEKPKGLGPFTKLVVIVI